MRARTVTALVVLATAAALAAGSGAANAHTLVRVVPSGVITATSPAITFASNLGNITCQAFITGGFREIWLKQPGTHTGGFNIMNYFNCSVLGMRANVSTLAGFWNWDYVNILGVLPSIRGYMFRVVNYRVLIEIPGVVRCLFTGDLLGLIASPGQPVIAPVPVLNLTSQLPGGIIACPPDIRMSLPFSYFPGQTFLLG